MAKMMLGTKIDLALTGETIYWWELAKTAPNDCDRRDRIYSDATGGVEARAHPDPGIGGSMLCWWVEGASGFQHYPYDEPCDAVGCWIEECIEATLPDASDGEG